MPPLPRISITERMLIVGEGDGDRVFFEHLCEVRGIRHFGFASASGNKDYERLLKGLESQPPLDAILVVADNDETPDANFDNVRKQIGKARLPQPDNPLHRASRAECPNVVVLMLPYPPIGNSTHGALETMLLPSAERHFTGQTACVDQYCRCILQLPAQWSRTEKDKMRLRCLLSGASNTDANVSLRHALSPDRGLIPLTDPAFDPLVLLLRNFSDWMQSRHPTWDAYKAARGI